MNTILLQDGQLRAQLLTPGNTRYVRTRFNHSAFISNVWLSGTRFTQYERNQNTGFISTDGCGLCSSYDSDDIMRDSDMGGWYLKPGVGVMRRDKDWGICEWPAFTPLDIRMDADKSSAHFETDTPNVNGYAYRETRDVRLAGDEIELAVWLKSTGEKTLVCDEYCHNFVSLGDEEIGPDYHLEVPSIPHPERLAGALKGSRLVPDETGFGFDGEIDQCFYVRCEDVAAAPVAWKLTHRRTPAFVQESVSFTPGRVAVWGDYYVVSCEVFLPVRLAPGEELRWTRRWKFGV